MKPWKLSELKTVLSCEVPLEAEITSVSSDSRTLQKGCLFVALKGERFDGHDFVENAIQAGAIAAVTDHQVGNAPCLVVSDTGRALIQIAGFYRDKFSPVVIAITGSVGKTTTKEMIAQVLEKKYVTLKNQGNLNNLIGLPTTLLELEERHQAAVVELGMSHFGEIKPLSLASKPSIGIITNVGFSHIENLKTQEGILQEKLEIQDGMSPDAPLILNGDDKLLAPLKHTLKRPVVTFGFSPECDVHVADFRPGAFRTDFVVADAGGQYYSIRLNCVGTHNVMDALAAFCAGTLAGVPAAQICEALGEFRTGGLRQHIYRRGPYTIIADCYNASPDSMKAALEVLHDLPCKGRHIAVLGDMLELGEMSRSLHTLVGDMVANAQTDLLFCYGRSSLHMAQRAALRGVAVYHTEDPQTLCQFVRQEMRPGDAILFKASRGMELERCISTIFEQEGEPTDAILD